MKNKHLLALFMATIAVGLLGRRLHWVKSDSAMPLIRLDTAAVTQFNILQPGQSPLLFERTDDGWAVEQEGRAYPVTHSDMAIMLAALGDLRSVRRVGQTDQPDTLGLGEKTALTVTLRSTEERIVQIALGQQIFEKGEPATYLRLGENGDIYLAKRHLRDVFPQKIEFFRKNQVANFDPLAVMEVSCVWPDDTALLLQKKDSLRRWHTLDGSRSVSDDSLQIWLRNLAALQNLPFADDFDESQSRRTLRAEINLRNGAGGTLQVFRLHCLAPPELPEEVGVFRRTARRVPVAWVLHSSQNPLNYFSTTDTAVFFDLLPRK